MAIIPSGADTKRRDRDLDRLADMRRYTFRMAELADVSNARAVEILAGYSTGTLDLDHALREIQLHYIELCKTVERQEAAAYASRAVSA